MTTAPLQARDGRDVTVIERDAREVPDSAQSAWDGWSRRNVAQFREPHDFMPGLRRVQVLQDAYRFAGESLEALPPSTYCG